MTDLIIKLFVIGVISAQTVAIWVLYDIWRQERAERDRLSRELRNTRMALYGNEPLAADLPSRVVSGMTPEQAEKYNLIKRVAEGQAAGGRWPYRPVHRNGK